MHLKHIIPIGDVRAHMWSLECACNPIVREGDEYSEVIHRFFDHREVVYGVEIMLGMRCEDCLSFMDEKGNHIEEPKFEEG